MGRKKRKGEGREGQREGRRREREKKKRGHGGKKTPPLPHKDLVFNKLSPDNPVLTRRLLAFDTGLEQPNTCNATEADL